MPSLMRVRKKKVLWHDSILYMITYFLFFSVEVGKESEYNALLVNISYLSKASLKYGGKLPISVKIACIFVALLCAFIKALPNFFFLLLGHR